jgi:hypothetical protein
MTYRLVLIKVFFLWSANGGQGVDNPTQCPSFRPSVVPYSKPTVAPTIRVCPAGTYPQSKGSSICNKCPAGTSSTNGAQSIADCISCSVGPASYSVAGSAVCTSCGTGQFLAGARVSKEDCRCLPGWSGSNCDKSSCEEDLSLGSLISLLFQSDSQLRIHAANFNGTNADRSRSANNYLEDLLNVVVDINGDGEISKDTELLPALKARHVYTSGMENFPVWCKTVSDPNAICYYNSVNVSTVLEDAMSNYKTSVKHQFDGSGVPSVIASMNSTFPDPSWTAAQCQATGTDITTQWTYVSPAGSHVFRVCGYRNGILDNNFVKSPSLFSGTVTFKDTTPVLSEDDLKRVFCLSVQYCTLVNGTCQLSAAGEIAWLQTYECSVGLIFVSAVFVSLSVDFVIYLHVVRNPNRLFSQATEDRDRI